MRSKLDGDKITHKDKLFKKYINMKNSTVKENVHFEYKALKNMINSLIYRSKTNYYTKYFNQYSIINND